MRIPETLETNWKDKPLSINNSYTPLVGWPIAKISSHRCNPCLTHQTQYTAHLRRWILPLSCLKKTCRYKERGALTSCRTDRLNRWWYDPLDQTSKACLVDSIYQRNPSLYNTSREYLEGKHIRSLIWLGTLKISVAFSVYSEIITVNFRSWEDILLR
jgi:hypothetical protein